MFDGETVIDEETNVQKRRPVSAVSQKSSDAVRARPKSGGKCSDLHQLKYCAGVPTYMFLSYALTNYIFSFYSYQQI